MVGEWAKGTTGRHGVVSVAASSTACKLVVEVDRTITVDDRGLGECGCGYVYGSFYLVCCRLYKISFVVGLIASLRFACRHTS